jgi:hypothetical protein
LGTAQKSVLSHINMDYPVTIPTMRIFVKMRY